ncbi:butyrophilin subfamily 3 member A2-like [Sebastes fasciatus]|uniref:butyrophilin subfamily 3 member A2-like n=1 Tax=Sebastes fasciatus TaxID=394691 RepID=UPI003D9DC6B9
MKLVINSSFKMLPQRTGLSLQSPLRPISVLVFHLLLTHSCRGQSQMIGLSQPIVALVGDDIILPCHLEPAVDVSAMTLEWTRPDLNSIAVFMWRAGKDLVHVKDLSYTGRTSLFTDGLKNGNISLKLSKVKLSDKGRYKCYVAVLDKESLVELVVASGAASYPVITLAGIDEATGGVMLDCRSEGWYPEPEVLWLDGEGNLLSAGPPETVRGPDDLYTVSSRVTVEKRHSNSFTCRVQQKNTNQTRETHIPISNDFFKLQSSSSPVTTGLAVSLAVWIIMFILLLLFIVWKWRKNRIKTQRNPLDQRERETLMKSKLVETKGAELQQLHEEKKRNENELQSLKEELENKKKEMERIQNTQVVII